MSAITAHCLVKNEEIFIEAVIRSAVDFVSIIIVYDTGSTDKTCEIISNLIKEYPNKIIFEEKGECDKKRHTELRQEMIDRTETDWFMILDGDEVWPRQTLEEAFQIIRNDSRIECIVVPFYLCVGDIYHRYFREGKIEMLGTKGFLYPRFIKKVNGVHWRGDYNLDSLMTNDGQVFVAKNNSVILKNKFWHLTHLLRSIKDDEDYSSGGDRRAKRRLTYFVIGKEINEPVPEVFGNKNDFKLSRLRSFKNFFSLVIDKL